MEWVAISFSNAWKWKGKVKLLSYVWLLATPWTADYQAPPSMGFSRQEYWSGLPLPSPWLDGYFLLLLRHGILIRACINFGMAYFVFALSVHTVALKNTKIQMLGPITLIHSERQVSEPERILYFHTTWLAVLQYLKKESVNSWKWLVWKHRKSIRWRCNLKLETLDKQTVNYKPMEQIYPLWRQSQQIITVR